MITPFSARTADDAWQEIATVFREGQAVSQQSRSGMTHEILHAAISITDPRQRWIVSRSPGLNPAFAIAEVVWIVRGRNDAKFLNYFNSGLPRFAGNTPTYHGAYGHRLRNRHGVDQLERAFEVLRADSNSRQVALQIWDAASDLPASDGTPAAPDIPCNVASLLKVRNDQLEWTQVIRSNDLFRGMPYNVVQFTCLQEVIAGWLGIEPGSYNQFSDSLHVYADCVDSIQKSRSGPFPENVDKIGLPKAESDRAFLELDRVITRVVATELSSCNMPGMLTHSELPQAFKNMLCVVCTEGARRQKDAERIPEIMALCTNPVYDELVVRWLARFQT